MISLIAVSCLAAFVSADPPTNIFASQAAFPWANPLDVCMSLELDGSESSKELLCVETCDSNNNCVRDLTLKQYDDTGCKSNDLISTTTIACDGENIRCNCYEDYELPGYTGSHNSNTDFENNHAIVKLRPAVTPGQTRGNIQNTIESMTSTDSLSVTLQKNLPKDSCDASDDFFEVALVTEKCFYYNWGKAKQEFEDDPTDPVKDVNKTTFFDLAFGSHPVFWYKITCSDNCPGSGSGSGSSSCESSDSSEEGNQQLLWQLYTDKDCTNKLYAPGTNSTLQKGLLLNQGCKDWAIFGSYLSAEITCKGERSDLNLTKVLRSGGYHSSPVVTFALAAAFAVIGLMQ